MTSNDLVFVKYKNIKNITVDVSSEISSKNLKEFIKTSIEIELQDNIIKNQVFVNYLQKLNKYEIYLYSAPNKLIIPQEIFYNKLTNKKYNLFITKDFFVVYFKNNFYISKDNNHYSNDDIINYLEFTYKIDIEDISINNISEEEVEILKKQYIQNKIQNRINYINFTSNNKYKYFLIYLFTLFLIVNYYFFIYQKQEIVYISNNDITLKKIKTKYYNALMNKYKNNKLVTNILIDIFNNLKQNQIILNSIKYNKVFYLNIQANDKNTLYKFCGMYKCEIKNLKYDKQIYIMDVEIEF